MAIHPLEAQLTGRILKTAAEVYENVLSTRPFLETNLRQNPAHLISMIQDIVASLNDTETVDLVKTLLQEAGAKVPYNLEEVLRDSVVRNMRRYYYRTPLLQDLMVDMTTPEEVGVGTWHPATESQLGKMIIDRLQNQYNLEPDTIKTLGAFLGAKGEQYQALRGTLPETPWIVPARTVYDQSLQEPRNNEFSLIDITGNDPFRLPISLLNIAVQRAIPRIKLPDPKYEGERTLQIPDLVLESAVLDQAVRRYVTNLLKNEVVSRTTLYTLGELIGALRLVQPVLIDHVVNSPEGQRILRESSLPGVKRLIENVRKQVRQGFTHRLHPSDFREELILRGLLNVRAVPTAPDLPEWMRRRWPAQTAEVVDPTKSGEDLKYGGNLESVSDFDVLKKMVLLAASPVLLESGIDPMKATTAQVMHALRTAQAIGEQPREPRNPFYLFNMASSGFLANPRLSEIGWKWIVPALPQLIQKARNIDPRVEKLPVFQELIPVATQVRSTPVFFHKP